MGEVFDAAKLDWVPVRPDVAQGVYGKTLLADGTKLVLTRVTAGGKFDMHQDSYGHLFYFLSGEGTVWVGGKKFEAAPGVVVRITAGELHAYENTGKQDLVLISANLT
jgi:mannose-6-phosphate isomerase-like protein (cupin superfamily)